MKREQEATRPKGNRLSRESSPYLLQHAYQPVDWYPWGEEAFERARQEDKPVFLSIGYSACHWCHRMAEESFEDETVAALLNQHFVAVKVDREIRPDIDEIYMSVCQRLTGQGGWPLTILMTPAQEPFFAGTYFPPQSRFGLPGLKEILGQTAAAWQRDRKTLKETGRRLAALAGSASGADHRAPLALKRGAAEFDRLRVRALTQLNKSFDRCHGGFGAPPKFPTPSILLYLLYESHFNGNKKAGQMAEKTLTQMYRGGIFDHVGFGFCRYSTDEKWLVPHFEKMLYDNAQLALTYTTAWQITGRPLYREVARKTLDYMLRELACDNGGFYSAQDADSEGREGAYYVFRPEELQELLGREEGAYFNQYFDITEKGNFEGFSIPNLLSNPQFGDPGAGASADGTNHRAQWLSQQVYTYRLNRRDLQLDRKILTGWNALAAVALIRAYRAMGNELYLQGAAGALELIYQRLWAKGRGLFLGGAFLAEVRLEGETAKREEKREGKAGETTAEKGKEEIQGKKEEEFLPFGPGMLEDYSYLIWAVLEMYQASLEIRWLAWAAELSDILLKEFWDEKNGGFFMTAASGESLIGRPKTVFDSALPSGNAAAAYDLLLLSRLTARGEYETVLQKQLDFLAAEAEGYPPGHGFALLTLLLAEEPARSLVCTLPESSEEEPAYSERRRLQALLNFRFLPDLVVLAKTQDNAKLLERLAPFSRSYPLKAQQSVFYLCRGRHCHAPCYSIQELARELCPGEK